MRRLVLLLACGSGALAGCEGPSSRYPGIAVFADEDTIVAVEGDGRYRRFQAPFEDGGEALVRIADDSRVHPVFPSGSGARALVGIQPPQPGRLSPYYEVTADGRVPVFDPDFLEAPDQPALDAAWVTDTAASYAWTHGSYGADDTLYVALWRSSAPGEWDPFLVSEDPALRRGTTALVVEADGRAVVDCESLVLAIEGDSIAVLNTALAGAYEWRYVDGARGPDGRAAFFHGREVGPERAVEIARVASIGTAWTLTPVVTVPGDPLRPQWTIFRSRMAAARGDAVATFTFECAAGEGCDGVVRWIESDGAGGWTMETVAVIEDELYDSWTFDARGTRVLTGGDRLLVHERGADGWTSRPIGRISDLEVGPACDVARASAPLARTRAVSFAAILAAVGALVARRRSGRV